MNSSVDAKQPDLFPDVKTEPLPTVATKSLATPPGVEDVEPEALARLMANCISDALAESPTPSPMEIVTRLLRLKTDRGHKCVWTRFDINQLFALYTNKVNSQRTGR